MGFLKDTTTSSSPSGNAGGDLGSTFPSPTVVSLADVTTGTLGSANGGTAQTTYTKGDIIYASAANTLSKLPIGSSAQVLTVASGVPSWAAASGGWTQDGSFTVSGGTSGSATLTNASYNIWKGTFTGTATGGLAVTLNSNTSDNYAGSDSFRDTSGGQNLSTSGQFTLTGTGGSLPNGAFSINVVILNVGLGFVEVSIEGSIVTTSNGTGQVTIAGRFDGRGGSGGTPASIQLICGQGFTATGSFSGGVF